MYVLPCGTDPQTIQGVLLYSSDTGLDPAHLFRFYGARFQIEFAFRDAKLHLSLNDGQARSQARLQADRFLRPFFVHQIKQRNFKAEIYKRMDLQLASDRNATNSEAAYRLPPQYLWLPPLLHQRAGRPLNTAFEPARRGWGDSASQGILH